MLAYEQLSLYRFFYQPRPPVHYKSIEVVLPTTNSYLILHFYKLEIFSSLHYTLSIILQSLYITLSPHHPLLPQQSHLNIHLPLPCLLSLNLSKISFYSRIERITHYGAFKYEMSCVPSDVRKLSKTTLRCFYVKLQ